jgi:hypothetical protein
MLGVTSVTVDVEAVAAHERDQKEQAEGRTKR